MNMFSPKTPFPAKQTLRALVLGGAVALSALFSSQSLLAQPLISGAQPPERVVLDKVIAIVDEGVVLQSELDRRLEEIQLQARQSGRPLPAPTELRAQVIEALVVESLQLQFASRMGVRFDDETLNRVFVSLAEASNMSFDTYIAELEQAGRYLETREQVRRELALREVQRGIVNRRINITDQEIENYLNSEMGRVTMAPDYLIDQILIPVSENDPANVVQAKQRFAEELHQRIVEGTDFLDVRMNAQRNAAANQNFPVSGAELGWRKVDQLPSLFAEIVPGMRIGAVNEPIRSSNGFHILKLVDVQGDSTRLVKQTHVRHILLTPNEIRTEQQTKNLIDNIYRRINEGENFSILARQYSDDTTTVVAGGDLNWLNEGAVSPEFERVMNDLDVGEVSEPFRTSFGWHIAEVLERREQDLSRQYRRQQAENTLRSRKFDIELENWLLEIREQAYVKVLI
jgi:peptidyl-prolyl cis-trans isomerase SurA